MPVGRLHDVTQDRRSPRPRLTDVAEVAGVSMKTVSNVVNGYAPVSEPTRSKVLAAVERVGYRPNLSARNLARGRSGVIVLAVPRLELPYFASLAGSVVEAAASHGWFVLIHQTGGDADGERRALLDDFPQRVDGMILSTQHLDPGALSARRETLPLVLLGDHRLHGAAPHVGIDNRAAALEAVRHLIAGGGRRLAMIGAAPSVTPDDRTAGMLEGLREAALPARPELLRAITANTGEEGERVTAQMLDEISEPPDALFAVTDWVAMGAIRALQARGLSVPDDVAVIGFDDIPYASSTSPSLTTIAPDRDAIARLAVEALEQLVTPGGSGDRGAAASPADTADTADTDLHAPFRLVLRESTRPVA